MVGILRAFAIQKRTLGALMMREIQIRWGRRNLGFAWLFAEPLVFAFPVLAMWSLMRSPSEHGLPLMPFLWSGYLGVLMFRHTASRGLYVIRQNAAMLYHRAVTPIDLVVARCGLELMGSIAATAFSFMILYSIGSLEWPRDVPLVLVGFLYMGWWSFSVALVLAAASERSEIVEHVWMPVSYIYLPICGFLYMAEWLPSRVRDIALVGMPPLHAYEMIRAGLLGNQVQTFYSMPYLSLILTVLTLIGLWLMHGVRQHLEVEW